MIINKLKHNLTILCLSAKALAFSGCSAFDTNDVYALPDDSTVFGSVDYCEEETGDIYPAIAYNDRVYVFYGELGGTMNPSKTVAQCLGYLYREAYPDDQTDRVCTLKATEDFLVTYYVNGMMETPRFYRAVDTIGQTIDVPSYIESHHAPIWQEELLSDWNKTRDVDYVATQLGVDLQNATSVQGYDSHGGFHGDGLLVLKFTFEDNAIAASFTKQGWHELPLSDNCHMMIANGASYDALITDAYGNNLIPVPENGYYFFYDRHSEATDPYDDTNVHARASWNFLLAVYDSATHTLYFAKFDT